ncbi:dihydropyrimidinase [Pseudoroseicyclus tamaricis]|uniref:D-hydantoinase n=1 Tax=Pseudoroseicyclus tamaricis TaxID=2705421 RepID=A0A6B2K2A6_9RHOB|nr:dihydropyrimidinase [Pseudoroseicyclus tamaricis]NDV00566.1 dihydropyrimidinase [Pseudoroseicyclus tamaricis]
MDLDLAIRGGTIVTSSGRYKADVGIRGGRIVAIADTLTAPDEIDATDRLVMPGGIEAHCHVAQESAAGLMTADDYRTGSISAAFGGNSTFIPFAAQHRGMSVAETLELYHERGKDSVLDYAFHLIVTNPDQQAVEHDLPEAFRQGITSLKVFLTYERMMVADSTFLDVLALAKSAGGLTMVHAENNGMIDWMSRRLVAAGHTEPRYHAISHPALAEAEAINRAISLSKLVDAPLLIVHVSTREGAELVARAQAEGAKVFAETCPQYLFLTRDDLDLPGMEGAKFMCSPPPRDAETQEVLWQHLARGTFTVFSSDHAPYRHDESGKLANGPEATFKQIANGMPGLAARLPLLFSGVTSGRITLEQFVALSSTNAARLYGMYPQKGEIAVGSDADIAIWDPAETREVRLEDQHDAMDYTPYEGMRLTGWPVAVLSRGERIIEDGACVAEPKRGRFVTRGPSDYFGRPGITVPEMDPARNFGAMVKP